MPTELAGWSGRRGGISSHEEEHDKEDKGQGNRYEVGRGALREYEPDDGGAEDVHATEDEHDPQPARDVPKLHPQTARPHRQHGDRDTRKNEDAENKAAHQASLSEPPRVR